MSSISEPPPPDGQLQVMLNELRTDVDEVYENNHFTGIKGSFLCLRMISWIHNYVISRMVSGLEQYLVDRKIRQMTSEERKAKFSVALHVFSYYKKDSEQFKEKMLQNIISYIRPDHDANDPSILLDLKNNYKMEESYYYAAPFKSSNLKYVRSSMLRFVYPIV